MEYNLPNLKFESSELKLYVWYNWKYNLIFVMSTDKHRAVEGGLFPADSICLGEL